MTYGSDGYSLSDIAAATGNNGRGNDGDGMFGNSGAWFIVLFLIFAVFGGFGRGFGNGANGGNGGAFDNYTLASDFATIQRQLSNGFSDLTSQSRYIQNGICDGFYAMNTGMLNGFAGVQNAMCQGFSGVNNSIMTNGYETRNAIQGVSSQLADCCCQTNANIKDVNYNIATQTCGIQRSIDGVNYNMATNTNTLQSAMCLNTRDIIDSQNNGTRAILDALTANRIEDKNAQIQAQQNEINALRLAASQEKQNSYLLDQLKPCPSAAYIVPNPNCCYNYNVTGYGYNNGGCNCGNY